jgi:hypothetical protein
MKSFYDVICAGPRKSSDLTDWRARHNTAVTLPITRISTLESSLVYMLRGWYDYARQHEQRFESKIGDDGFLGPAWEEMGDNLRTLLNGDIGRLDGGTVDGFILNTMRENGVDTEHK